MRPPILLRSLVVIFLSITLLAPGALAKSDVATAPGSGKTSVEVSELPLYLQLLAYVADLLTAGQEVPKALLNKIEAYAKSGK